MQVSRIFSVGKVFSRMAFVGLGFLMLANLALAGDEEKALQWNFEGEGLVVAQAETAQTRPAARLEPALTYRAESEYTISGYIRESGSGDPIEEVTVTLTGDLEGTGPLLTQTDAEGLYEFVVRLDGPQSDTEEELRDFTVTPTKEQYTFDPASTDIVNMAGDSSKTADFDGTQSEGARVEGRVLLDGAGLQGVTVRATGDGAGPFNAVTGADGSYSITITEAPWDFTATPDLSGYTFAPTIQTGRITALGEVVNLEDFIATAEPTEKAVVEGYVKINDAGLSGVAMEILVDGTPSSTVTDDAGYYAFELTESGANFEVTPTLDGYVFDPVSQSGTVPDLGNTESLVDFVASFDAEPSTVSGTILLSTGGGLAGVEVFLQGEKESVTVTTDADGNYTATIESPDWSGSVLPVLEFYAFEPAARILEIAGDGQTITGQDFTAYDITIGDVALVTGKITDIEGQPMENVLIVANLGGEVEETVSGFEGNYTFTVTELPWNATLTANMEGYIFDPADREVSVTEFGTVNDGNHFVGTPFSEGQSVISGYVKREDGRPVPNMDIFLLEDITPFGPVGQDATTDSSGFYQFVVDEVTTDGYTAQIIPQTANWKFEPEYRDVLLTQPGQDLPNQNFTATPLNFVTGMVSLEGGEFLDGMVIEAVENGTGKTWYATTQEDGFYVLHITEELWSGVVRPAASDIYAFTPEQYSIGITEVGTIREDIDFQGEVLTDKARISGTIRTDDGYPAPRVKVVARNTNTGDTVETQTNNKGYYEFLLETSSWSGTLTPDYASYTFQPSSRNVVITYGGQQVVGQDFVAFSGSLELPEIPHDPYPNDGAEDVYRNPRLSWVSANATEFDIYLWYPPEQGRPALPTFTTTDSYQEVEDLLEENTQYAWQVVARNLLGEVEGPTWVFTTGEDALLPPPPPVNPTPSDGAINQPQALLLQWDVEGYPDGEGAPQYDFQLWFGESTNPGDWMQIAQEPDLYRYLVSGLEKGTTYYWQVWVTNATGTTKGEIWSFTTLEGSLNQARDPFPEDGATGVDPTVELLWSSGNPEQADQVSETYQIYFGTTPELTVFHKQGLRSLTRFRPRNTLEYNQTYYWRVDTINLAGLTKGQIWSFTVEEPPALAPEPTRNPSPADGITSQALGVLLEWQNGGRATSYRVYFGNQETLTDGDYLGESTVLYREVEGLLPQSTYYWRVDAVNEHGITTGNVWAFSTGRLPNAVNGTYPLNGATHIPILPQLQWEVAANAASYDVYLSTSADLQASDLKGNLPYTAYQAGPLKYATTYYWRIDSRNNVGFTPGDVWSFTTEPRPTSLPEPAQNPNPADGATHIPTALELRWENGGGAASYDFYLGLSPEFSREDYYGNVLETRFSPETLQADTLYYWRVDSKNALGTTQGAVWSFNTGEVGVTPPAKAVQPSPAHGAQFQPVDVVLQWQDGGRATHYDVYFGLEPELSQADFVSNQSGLSFALNGLAHGVTYYWKVNARNSGGMAEGDVWSFTTESEYAENDNFADAWQIRGVAGRQQGSNRNAGREAGEPYHLQYVTGATVWFKWTAPADGNVVLYTENSSLDTLLAAYQGDRVDQLRLMAANDEAPSEADEQWDSMVQFDVEEGRLYHIVVQGFNEETGQFVLSWNLGAKRWLQNFGSSQGWDSNLHFRALGDVNADGFEDLVGCGDDRVFVSLSNGGNLLPAENWSNFFTVHYGWNNEDHLRALADMNGDDRQDLVGFGDKYFFVGRSLDYAFAAPRVWLENFTAAQGWNEQDHLRMMADLDQDGYTDVVGFGKRAVLWARSNGQSLDAPQTLISNFGVQQGWRKDKHCRKLGDVDGDGKLDIVGFGDHYVLVALSAENYERSRIWAENFTWDKGWRTDRHVREVADVNADGHADIIGFGDAGVYVALSEGDGFGPAQVWLTNGAYHQGWRKDRHLRLVRDLDGDGRVDILGCGNGATFVSMSVGNSFTPLVRWCNSFAWLPQWPRQGWSLTQDYRGLHRLTPASILEVVGIGEDGVYVY